MVCLGIDKADYLIFCMKFFNAVNLVSVKPRFPLSYRSLSPVSVLSIVVVILD